MEESNRRSPSFARFLFVHVGSINMSKLVGKRWNLRFARHGEDSVKAVLMQSGTSHYSPSETGGGEEDYKKITYRRRNGLRSHK